MASSLRQTQAMRERSARVIFQRPPYVGIGPRGRFVRPGSSYVVAHAPRPSPHYAPNAGYDLRSQLYEMRYNGRRFIAFLSILLGDDQVLDEGVTGNERVEGRGVTSGTDHDTLQRHGGELASPTTTLWLPENLKNRAATLGYKDGEDFLNNMRMIFGEVLKFGARATHVARAFARMEFHRVKPVLFNVNDLRVALQALVDGTETKLPLMDPHLPNVEDSIGFVPSASYVLEPRRPRVGSNADDIPSQLRDQFYDSEQFYIFLSILLGEDHPADEHATVNDDTAHDSQQPHGVPKRAVWLPEYLKKKDKVPDYRGSHCWDQLMGLFREAMKLGVGMKYFVKGFATMEDVVAEYCLNHPEFLRSALQEAVTILKDTDIRELIKKSMPEVESDPNIGIPLDALPETSSSDVEPIDDDYIKLSVFRYFGQM